MVFRVDDLQFLTSRSGDFVGSDGNSHKWQQAEFFQPSSNHGSFSLSVDNSISLDSFVIGDTYSFLVSAFPMTLKDNSDSRVKALSRPKIVEIL